jgi:Pyridoxamine 5'-phosphate oxidase
MSDLLKTHHIKFIEQQHVFFVATAPPSGFINLSPKGMDSFRVLDESTIIWLNLTGSGNETAAHLLEDDRMTIMFCAFEGSPMILRLYGHCKAIHHRNKEWNEFIQLFPDLEGSRQLMKMNLTRVATSCGFGVPTLEFKEERQELIKWSKKKGPDGLNEYWEKKNVVSLDQKRTGIFE